MAIGIAAITVIGCNQSDPSMKVDHQTANAFVMTIRLFEGNVVVKLENGSEEEVAIAGAPLIGFSLGDPRIAISVKRSGEEVHPCAHLDAAASELQTISLAAHEVYESSVPLDLLRKVYCLRDGKYQLQAIYPAGVSPEHVSNEVEIVIEHKPE